MMVAGRGFGFLGGVLIAASVIGCGAEPPATDGDGLARGAAEATSATTAPATAPTAPPAPTVGRASWAAGECPVLLDEPGTVVAQGSVVQVLQCSDGELPACEPSDSVILVPHDDLGIDEVWVVDCTAARTELRWVSPPTL